MFAIFEFVHVLVEKSMFKGAVKTSLSQSSFTCRYVPLNLKMLIEIGQITEEQCTKWSENPDSLVEDEDTFAYNVRISSQDLLMALSEEFEQECCASLAQVLGHLM